MTSGNIIYSVHTLLFRTDCVDSYKVLFDNNTEDVTVNITYVDNDKKRYKFYGGQGLMFEHRVYKTWKRLLDYTEEKEKTLKEKK